MSLSRKTKTALDETRMLMLGAQVLFGFKLNGVFHERFADLDMTSRLIDCAGLVLMAMAIGLLIAPSMLHRLVEGGQDTARVLRAATLCAGAALLPFAISLCFAIYIALVLLYGPVTAAIAGGSFGLLAALFWYAIPTAVARESKGQFMSPESTPLPAKIEQMLTEARIILPGAQALLGFQLAVTLMSAFEHLSPSLKLVHVVALCCVALAIILLMAPAALHRIAFAGEANATFFSMGSAFVIAAPLPLALGMTADLFVTAATAAESTTLGAGLAAVVLVVLLTLWYGVPLYIRMRNLPSEAVTRPHAGGG